ncbi:MAG: hypothetical protein M1812_006378 [Candelaria pacifica]|nr:MAG: hypothetical protein M1812_006378 [Candelaria pacifica]
MSSQIKPIKIWGQGGPNPPKVNIIMEELGLPYEVKAVPFSEIKNAEYVAVNPNGRIPAIQDPNTGITLWESGAIIEYLIERYDTKHHLSFAPGTPESYHAKQWLFFQVTGQGPYYGQAVWFQKYHSEKLPSAIERYHKEINRVSGVLEERLAQQKRVEGAGTEGPWLVGDKFSYADIAFIPWQWGAGRMFEKNEYDVDNFPNVKEWLNRMTSREAVKKGLEIA